MDSGLIIIVCILAIPFTFFQIALMVRLWGVLGMIRRACRLFSEDSQAVKKRAIELYNQGRQLDDIAYLVNVPFNVVEQWINSEKNTK